MKCYITDQSFRLSGKGWEIRHYLRGAASAAPPHTTLAEWLGGRMPKPSSASRSIIARLHAE